MKRSATHPGKSHSYRQLRDGRTLEDYGVISVMYNGISVHVINLQPNLYLNVFLDKVAEMPAVLLDKFMRKPLAIGIEWFSGFFCLVRSLMKLHGIRKVLRMVCGILGIFGMAGTCNLLFIYMAELFPTMARYVAHGCVAQAGQMGAILAPFEVVLGGIYPFAVCVVCATLGGILAFYLSETLNQSPYDTMAGMEDGESVCTSV